MSEGVRKHVRSLHPSMPLLTKIILALGMRRKWAQRGKQQGVDRRAQISTRTDVWDGP
jgi:hypothetical protein